MSPILPALGRLAPALIKWLGVGSTVFFAGDAVKSVAAAASGGPAPASRPVRPLPPPAGPMGLPANPAAVAQYLANMQQYESAMDAYDAAEADAKMKRDLYRVAMLTALGLVAAKVIDSVKGGTRRR